MQTVNQQSHDAVRKGRFHIAVICGNGKLFALCLPFYVGQFILQAHLRDPTAFQGYVVLAFEQLVGENNGFLVIIHGVQHVGAVHGLVFVGSAGGTAGAERERHNNSQPEGQNLFHAFHSPFPVIMFWISRAMAR